MPKIFVGTIQGAYSALLWCKDSEKVFFYPPQTLIFVKRRKLT